MKQNASCELPSSQQLSKLEQRHTLLGHIWVIGSFAICPCHLPLTLGFLGSMFGSTFLGAALGQYPWVAGIILTAGWAFGTFKGFRLLGHAERFAKQREVSRQQNP